VHYRLARLDDPVLQGVLDSVAHAVGHLRTPARDLRRLARRIELTPAERGNESGSCCSPLREGH
jgi:hypothetical protein